MSLRQDPAPGADPDPDAPDPGAADAGTTQDVRFAVAMSGGVSLAVWMGGVAREINLLQQASRSLQRDPGPVPDQAALPAPGGPDGSTAAVARAGDGDGAGVDPGHGPASPVDWDTQVRNLYRGLLDCLDITVTVDVLAGTSAGGVNAALLGLSSAAGADLARLRDLWLKTGSMDLLLRDPAERNPPSLMQGDKVLFTQLAQGIEGFWEGRPAPGAPFAPVAPPDTTVFITTTMMSGETSQFTDYYGTEVPDVDHHGLFTFHQKDLACLTPRTGRLWARPGPRRTLQCLVPGGVRALVCPDPPEGHRGNGGPAPAGHGRFRQHDPQSLGR